MKEYSTGRIKTAQKTPQIFFGKWSNEFGQSFQKLRLLKNQLVNLQ